MSEPTTESKADAEHSEIGDQEFKRRTIRALEEMVKEQSKIKMKVNTIEFILAIFFIAGLISLVVRLITAFENSM